MNVTGTGIAVALAVIIAFGFLIFGSTLMTPFATPQSATDTLPALATTTMTNPQELPTALTVTDVAVGTGKEARAGATVSVNYVGMLPDGTVFDASQPGQPVSFPLGVGMLIRGWDEGLIGMKEGGKRHLIVPGDMAYGSNPPPGSGIPQNATLIFDVELVSVQ